MIKKLRLAVDQEQNTGNYGADPCDDTNNAATKTHAQ
jgi:hypothetical protein